MLRGEMESAQEADRAHVPFKRSQNVHRSFQQELEKSSAETGIGNWQRIRLPRLHE